MILQKRSQKSLAKAVVEANAADPEIAFVKEDFQSGQKTAKKAAEILVSKNLGFVVPTAREKQNLLVAFAKKGKLVYGRAFDIVKLSTPVNLGDLSDIEENLG